jgi:hypothetical protein
MRNDPRFFVLFALLLLCACDRGDSPAPAGNADARTAPGFSGRYSNADNTIEIMEQSGRLMGTIHEGASSLPFTAAVTGNTARGDLKNPLDGQLLGTINLTLDGDRLSIDMSLRNPETGEAVDAPRAVLTRSRPAPSDVQASSIRGTAAGGPAGDTRSQSPAPDVSKNDPRVVGRWRYTWTAASGGASMAVDEWLYIEADGTCRDGPRKSAGGDANTGFQGSDEAGPLCHWRTENKQLYSKLASATDWNVIGRYTLHENKMMITYPNGNKRIYYRQ